jgi:uncharacterized protein (DUF1778 family)
MKMISLRLNDKELEALETAAAGDKLKLTTWIKQAAMKAADSRRERSDRTESNQKAPIFTE